MFVLEVVKEVNILNYMEKFFKFNNLVFYVENYELGEVGFDKMFWKMGFVLFKNFFLEFFKVLVFV